MDLAPIASNNHFEIQGRFHSELTTTFQNISQYYHRMISYLFLTLMWLRGRKQHFWFHMTEQWKLSVSSRFRIISSDFTHKRILPHEFDSQDYQSSLRSVVSRPPTP